MFVHRSSTLQLVDDLLPSSHPKNANLDAVRRDDAERPGEGQRHDQAEQDLRDPIHRFSDACDPQTQPGDGLAFASLD